MVLMWCNSLTRFCAHMKTVFSTKLKVNTVNQERKQYFIPITCTVLLKGAS